MKNCAERAYRLAEVIIYLYIYIYIYFFFNSFFHASLFLQSFKMLAQVHRIYFNVSNISILA